MGTSEIKSAIFSDGAFMGMRVTIGAIFILHGVGKFNPGFLNFMDRLGLPPELQIPIALAEVVPGIMIMVGVLSRVSAAILAIIMLGAIFLVKGAGSITGERGTELDLILLAAALVVMVAGPGRISAAQLIKKIPRILH